MIHVCFFHVVEIIRKVLFIFSNGPLLFAIIVWGNSLVFHDFDRITSVYIHFLPAQLSYTMGHKENQSASLNFQDYIWAALLYMTWQVLYIWKTEVADKHVLDADPTMLTSLRWLTTSKKNAFTKNALKLLKNMRIYGPKDTFKPESIGTKLTFVIFQAIYTFIVCLPSCFLYSNERLHLSTIMVFFACAVYGGGSYYIEIFSARYQLKFNREKSNVKLVAQQLPRYTYLHFYSSFSLA